MNILIQMFTEQALWFKIYIIIALYLYICVSLRNLKIYVVNEIITLHELLWLQISNIIRLGLWPIYLIGTYKWGK